MQRNWLLVCLPQTHQPWNHLYLKLWACELRSQRLRKHGDWFIRYNIMKSKAFLQIHFWGLLHYLVLPNIYPGTPQCRTDRKSGGSVILSTLHSTFKKQFMFMGLCPPSSQSSGPEAKNSTVKTNQPSPPKGCKQGTVIWEWEPPGKHLPIYIHSLAR